MFNYQYFAWAFKITCIDPDLALILQEKDFAFYIVAPGPLRLKHGRIEAVKSLQDTNSREIANSTAKL